MKAQSAQIGFVRRWLVQAVRFKLAGDIETARGCLRRAWYWKCHTGEPLAQNVPLTQDGNHNANASSVAGEASPVLEPDSRRQGEEKESPSGGTVNTQGEATRGD